MQLEITRIPSGAISLAALRYLPTGSRKDIALVYAHGFTAGKYTLDGLAGYLAARGYEGLTFDLAGHKLGGSGGVLLRAEQAAENMRDALDWLRQNTQARRIVLAGHSMGGAATLQAAAWNLRDRVDSEPPYLAGVITLCIGLDPALGFESPLGKSMLAQRADYVLGAPALELIHGLSDLLPAAREIGSLPALLVAGRQDILIPPERIEALAAQIGPSASFVVLESSHQDTPDRARGVIVNWLDRLL